MSLCFDTPTVAQVPTPTTDPLVPELDDQDLFGNSWLLADLDGGMCTAEGDTVAQTATPAQGPTPDDQVNSALDSVRKNFETGWTDWAVTDADATAALGTIKALPPELQGKAIEKMDKSTFDTLISEVPKLDREQFKSMMDNTHDPERKLKLWAEYHKSMVENEANKDKLDQGDWYWRSDAQKENKRLNDRRGEIVDATKSEVDDEVNVAMARLAKGQLTEADVQGIIDRKNKEYDIEKKYNVNLTSQEGVRQKGVAGFNKDTKICWTTTELDQLEKGLSRMPIEDVRGNKLLKRINRGEQNDDHTNWGGDHNDGVINIYDLGVTGNYRHTGQQPEQVAPGTGGPMSGVEETIAHEIGHDIHDQNPEAYEKFKASVGWKEKLNSSELKDAGVSDADIAALEDGSKSSVTVNGKVYNIDPYNTGPFGGKRFVSHDEGAIPEGGEWWYARTNSKDHFAETYMKAVHKPDTLAKDLIDDPAARVTQANAACVAAEGNLKRLKEQTPPATPEQISAAEKAVADQKTALADAQSDQGARRTQYDTMRNDVFHAPASIDEAAKRLEGRGVPPEKVAEFRNKCSRCITPQQVALVEAGY